MSRTGIFWKCSLFSWKIFLVDKDIVQNLTGFRKEANHNNLHLLTFGCLSCLQYDIVWLYTYDIHSAVQAQSPSNSPPPHD